MRSAETCGAQSAGKSAATVRDHRVRRGITHGERSQEVCTVIADDVSCCLVVGVDCRTLNPWVLGSTPRGALSRSTTSTSTATVRDSVAESNRSRRPGITAWPQRRCWGVGWDALDVDQPVERSTRLSNERGSTPCRLPSWQARLTPPAPANRHPTRRSPERLSESPGEPSGPIHFGRIGCCR